MKMYAKCVKVLDLISGTSDNGKDWEKQTVVFETLDERKRLLAVEFMGERKTRITKTLTPGMLCEVVFEPESREWGDRWFTKLEGFSLKPLLAAEAESTETTPAD